MSDSDKTVFENSIEPQDLSIPFQSKKLTFVNDSSSVNGQFSSQLQFDLQTLSSQNNWNSLAEAVIQFPVKLRIRNVGSGAQAPFANDAYSAVVKAGFHHFIDSVNITIGGNTIQQSQNWQNVATTFKILSEWSQDEYEKYGQSLAFTLDDYKPSTYGTLDNLPIDTLSADPRGVVLPFASNPGAQERARFLNCESGTGAGGAVASPGASNKILGNTNAIKSSKWRVVHSGTTAVAAGSDAFVMAGLATVRLADLSDVASKLPLMKNLKGFIYVNINTGSVDITSNASGVITSMVTSCPYGRTMPAMIGTFVPSTSVAAVWRFTAEVSSANTGVGLTDPSLPYNGARLYCPYYVGSPECDRQLSMKKRIRYSERTTGTISVPAGQPFNGTLSPGISNPQRITLLPLFAGANSATAGLTSFEANPERSPYDIVPAGSSPFAALSNLQFTVGGIPMFQSPVDMDWDQFSSEIATQGLDGGQNSQQNSGLLSQRTWNQLYRFYTCDLKRRIGAEDGASKAIQASFNMNVDSSLAMNVIYNIESQKEIVVDTAMGVITTGV